MGLSPASTLLLWLGPARRSSHLRPRASYPAPAPGTESRSRHFLRRVVNFRPGPSRRNFVARHPPFAEREVMERHLGLPDHSGLMLAARITFAHLAVSDLMTTANSSGELRDASRPSCAIRSRTTPR